MQAELYNFLIKDMIRKKLNEHIKNSALYPGDPKEKFNCTLCEGLFTRQGKRQHEKSDLHKEAIRKIKINCKKLINFFN
jgi:hypothetical protein